MNYVVVTRILTFVKLFVTFMPLNLFKRRLVSLETSKLKLEMTVGLLRIIIKSFLSLNK